MKKISPKHIKLALLLSVLFAFNAVQSQFNADPLEKWKAWGQMGEMRLEGGNASHNLSPAEIIYFLAKRNEVNPVLIIAKLQDEQSLIDYPHSLEHLEYHLNKATGYGCNGTNSNCSGYLGFYPQVAGCAFQFRRYQNLGKSFKQSYETYTMAHGAYSNFVNKIYPVYAKKMNEICATEYATRPRSANYFSDFVAEMSLEDIQKLLEAFNGRLKDENLFRLYVTYEATEVPYQQTVKIMSLDSIYAKLNFSRVENQQALLVE